MNEFIVNINDKQINVNISAERSILINGTEFNYDLSDLKNNSYLLKLAEKVYLVNLVEKNNGEYELLINNTSIRTITRSSLEHKAIKLIEEAGITSHHHTEMKAPMPGMILKIKKTAGDKILQGESVLILEAMKMENDLKAPASGILKQIFVTEGTAVEKGSRLFSIE